MKINFERQCVKMWKNFNSTPSEGLIGQMNLNIGVRDEIEQLLYLFNLPC